MTTIGRALCLYMAGHCVFTGPLRVQSAIFGRSSEKEITDTMSGQQLCFAFNEAEVTIDLDPDIPEPEFEEICPKTYRRTKQKGKREADLKDLKTTVVTHELTEAELLEKFPDGKWKQLPDQIYKRLEFHPACFEVIEHHVAVYAGDEYLDDEYKETDVELIAWKTVKGSYPDTEHVPLGDRGIRPLSEASLRPPPWQAL